MLREVGPSADRHQLSGLRRVLSASRSGLIAASVLGLSVAPACVPSGNSPGADTVIVDVGPEFGPQPEYGMPADIPDQPAYGVIPVDVGPAQDASTDTGNPSAPAYGLPADATP